MLYNVITGLKNIIYVIIFIIFEILKPQTVYIMQSRFIKKCA